MKKLAWAAIGAASVAAAAFAAATAYSGHQLQKALLAQPRQWARVLPFVEVHELTYDKGFAGATRTTTLKLGCPGTPPLMLTWRDTISHGPWPGGSVLGAALIESEFMLGKNAPPVTARTVVDFAGGTKTELAVAQSAFDLPQGRAAWQGVKLQWHAPAEGAASYTIDVPAFELHDTAQGVTLKLGGLAVRGQGLPGLSWAAAGSGSGELASLELKVQPAGAPAYEAGVRKVKLVNGAQLDERGLLHATSSLAGEAWFGGAAIDRFELQASLKRLHAPSYEELLAGLAGAACDPQALQRDSAALQAALLRMLPHNPEFALDKLTLSHAGRHAQLSYAAAVDGVTEAELRGAVAPVLRAKASLRLDLRVPALWFDQALPAAASQRSGAPSPVESLLQQGLLVRDGEMLSAQLRLMHGALSLNGRPMPF